MGLRGQILLFEESNPLKTSGQNITYSSGNLSRGWIRREKAMGEKTQRCLSVVQARQVEAMNQGGSGGNGEKGSW